MFHHVFTRMAGDGRVGRRWRGLLIVAQMKINVTNAMPGRLPESNLLCHDAQPPRTRGVDRVQCDCRPVADGNRGDGATIAAVLPIYACIAAGGSGRCRPI
jgi:hypothetical protein